MEKKALSEALSKALDMEEKGYNFYKEKSGKSKNDITRKTFSWLADNEILHIESIKKFCDTLKEKGEFPSAELGDIKNKRAEDLNIFSRSLAELKEKIKPADDDRKACEFAMEFENNGYKYYEKLLKKTKDENLIKLLEFLLGEESKHYESIMNLHHSCPN